MKGEFISIILVLSESNLGRDVLYKFMLINLDRILNKQSNGEDIILNIYFLLSKFSTNDSELKRVSIYDFKKIFSGIKYCISEIE